MAKIWINKRWIPKDKWCPGDTNTFMEITVPDSCKDCGNVMNIEYAGDSNTPVIVADFCEHYNRWAKFWDNRIQNVDIDQQPAFCAQPIGFTIIKSRSNKVDLANDGMKCSGSCGNWTPMAIANQVNGTFICYGCRSRF